jgi:uncharacterized protein (TIGR02231 family)
MHARHEAIAEVQLEVTAAREAALDVDVDLAYRTPCALWRPEHVARLTTGKDGKHQLTIKTSAVAWQRTGEEWRNVTCRFSTARPAQVASPPLVTQDTIYLTKKLERAIAVEAREQAINLAGLDRGTRDVDEMPGVDDGGEPLWLDASRPVTIPSDGQPLRIDVGEIAMPCEVDLVCYPERGMAAHVRATATLGGARPLLAGPVKLARDAAIVGRGKTAFVGQGEPFELGFGPDDGVRVRRSANDSRETTLVGTQKITKVVRLYLSNVGDAPRRVKVIERLPVSEIDDVTIKVLDAGGAKIDDDGFARFEVDLEANATRDLQFEYRIDAASSR